MHPSSIDIHILFITDTKLFYNCSGLYPKVIFCSTEKVHMYKEEEDFYILFYNKLHISVLERPTTPSNVFFGELMTLQGKEA